MADFTWECGRCAEAGKVADTPSGAAQDAWRHDVNRHWSDYRDVPGGIAQVTPFPIPQDMEPTND